MRRAAVAVGLALLGCAPAELQRVGPFLPGERALLVAAAVAGGERELVAMDVGPTLVELPGPATALEVATSSLTLAELGLTPGPFELAASRATGRVVRYERLLAGPTLSTVPLTSERLLWPLAVVEDPPEACLDAGGCWTTRPGEGYGRCVVPCPAPAPIEAPEPPSPPRAPCGPGLVEARSVAGFATCRTSSVACAGLGRFDRDLGACTPVASRLRCSDRSADPPDAAYVRPSLEPGDGSLAAPFSSVELALARGARRLVLLPHDGSYATGVLGAPGSFVEIVGACPDEVRLEGSSHVVGEVRLANLRLFGALHGSPTLEVSGRLRLEDAIVESGPGGALGVAEGGAATVTRARLGSDPRTFAAVVQGTLELVDAEVEGSLDVVGGHLVATRSRIFGGAVRDRIAMSLRATARGGAPATVDAADSAIVGTTESGDAYGILAELGAQLSLLRSLVSLPARDGAVAKEVLSLVDTAASVVASHLAGGQVLASRSNLTIEDAVFSGPGSGLQLERATVRATRVAIDGEQGVLSVRGPDAELQAFDLAGVQRSGRSPALSVVDARVFVERARLEEVAIEGTGAELTMRDLELVGQRECLSCDPEGQCMTCLGAVSADDASKIDLVRARIAIGQRRGIDVRSVTPAGGEGHLHLDGVSIVGGPECAECRGLTFFPSDSSRLEARLRGLHLERLGFGVLLGAFDLDLVAESLRFADVACPFALPESFDLAAVAVRAHVTPPKGAGEPVRCPLP